MSSVKDKKAVYIEGTKQAYCLFCKSKKTITLIDFSRRIARICPMCFELVRPPEIIKKCPTCGREFKTQLNNYCVLCCPKYKEDTFSELLMERPW